jgi:F-type H+-transporting ATPase subunit b
MEIFMDIILLNCFPLGHSGGFGLNTNILDTNIINLTVVLGVLVTVGGDALRSILTNRKEAILSSLQEAEQKAKDAVLQLEEAKTALSSAKSKAEEIRKQSVVAAEKEKNQILMQTEEDTKRLEQTKQEIIQLQQQTALQTLSKQVVSLALNQVQERLMKQKRTDSSFHRSITNFHIVLLRNYKA